MKKKEKDWWEKQQKKRKKKKWKKSMIKFYIDLTGKASTQVIMSWWQW